MAYNGSSRPSRTPGLTHRRSQTFDALPPGRGVPSDSSGSSRRDRDPPTRSALGLDTDDRADRRRSWQLRDEMANGQDRGQEDRSTSSSSPIRERSGSLLAKLSREREGTADRPTISAVGLRSGVTGGFRHGLPSPPNTNSDAGSGLGSGSAGKRSIGALLGRRTEGVLTPAGSDRFRGDGKEGGLKAEEPRRVPSDAGSRGSGSIRRRPATSRVSTGGTSIAPDADSYSQGSGSQTSRNSPRRASQLLRRTDSSNSSSPKLPTSPLVRSNSRRSSVEPDISPAKTVVPNVRASAATMSRSSLLRLKPSSRVSGSIRSNATARPERSASVSSSSSSLGTGRVRAKDKGKEVSRGDERPVMVGKSTRLVSMKEKNERILAQVNAALASPTSSPSKELPNPIVKEPSPSFEVTPPTSLRDTRPPPGSRASTIASFTSSNDEGSIPFAKGRSPAPRKVTDEGGTRKNGAVATQVWDGSVRRLAPPRPLASGAEAFAGDDTDGDDGPPGSMRRIPAKSEAPSSTSLEQEARKRVEDWTASAGEAVSGRRTPSASIRGHRRNLSETMTSSSGTARNLDPDEADSDAETTPGKGKQRSVSRASSRLRQSASVDDFGSVRDGSVRGWRTIDAAITRREREREGGWSNSLRSSGGDRSQTSMAHYPSTVSYARSSVNRPAARAASVLGDYRSSTVGRRSMLIGTEKSDRDELSDLPALSSSGSRKVRPGLPDDFLDSPRHRSRAFRGSDSRSNGSGSAGKPFPSTTPARDRAGLRGAASEVGGTAGYDDFDSASQASTSYRGSIRRQSDMSGRSPRTTLPSPLAGGASARGRHLSLTEIASRGSPKNGDVFDGQDRERRGRSSFSPSNFADKSSAKVGGPGWWNDLDDLRNRISQMDPRPESRAGGPSRAGFRPLSRAENHSTPDQRPERERETTLRGTQTAPSMSRISSGDEPHTSSYSAGSRRIAPPVHGRDRRSTIEGEPPRTPATIHHGRLTSMGSGRPGSARSGPFSTTPEVETHRLLLQSYDALDRHFSQPDDEQSADLVGRLASVVRTTCRLNSDLRTLADSMREAQVELQIEDGQSTVAIGSLDVLDRMAQRALSTSHGQIRDLTEALLALPRADRERAVLRQEDPASFRPQSRAGRVGSPDKMSPADRSLSSSGNRQLRSVLGNHFDDSPSLGHRRGGSTVGSRSSIFANGRLHSPLTQTGGTRGSVERSRTIGGGEGGRDSPRPSLRPSKSSATSILSSTTAVTVKPSPSLSFPRSPSKPSPKVSELVAEAQMSPTKRTGNVGADALGLVYEPLNAEVASNGRPRSIALESPSGSPPKRRGSGGSRGSGSGSRTGHRRRLSNAAAALERIGSLTRRGFGKTPRGSLGPQVDDASADISDAFTIKTESSEGAREERREKVNDILMRRSASRATMND